MTPQEALAQALVASGLSYEQPPDEDAARVLDALPEGWVLLNMDDEGAGIGMTLIDRAARRGAQQERERLRAKKCDIWCANCGEHVGTDDFDPENDR